MRIEIIKDIVDALSAGEDIAVARVVSDIGSTPRSAGASMTIREDGKICGTIGGGLVEAAAISGAVDIFSEGKSKLLTVEMSGDSATGPEMICGGNMDIFIEHISHNSNTTELYRKAEIEWRENRKCVLITEVMDNALALKKWLVLSDGMIFPEDRGIEKGPFSENLQGLLYSSVVNSQGLELWADVIRNDGTLFVLGAGHVGREAAFLAQKVGFRVIAIDDRAEFSNNERFPYPMQAVALGSFKECFEGFTIDDDSYIVIVTRGHMHDRTVLIEALKTKAGYIGMIGSRKKRDTIYNSLKEEGYSGDDIDRVYSPIGLRIDTETPEEIAVSIVGELIQVRSEKRKRI
jgi:xanthine dehydrogenase accessory factor